jgi:hypothetical protein
MEEKKGRDGREQDEQNNNESSRMREVVISNIGKRNRHTGRVAHE